MAKFNGMGIAAFAAGALLLYSAIEGKNFSEGLRSILSGSSPGSGANATTTAYPIAGTPASDFDTTSDITLDSASVTTPSNSSETAWITAFLTSIGAPATTANINSISSWIAHESVYPGNGVNSGGLYNPLNTTLVESGSSDYNSVGVQNYVSEAQGLEATVSTLLGGNYNDIVAALRSGNGLCGQSFAGLSTWSGGGYSQVC